MEKKYKEAVTRSYLVSLPVGPPESGLPCLGPTDGGIEMSSQSTLLRLGHASSKRRSKTHHHQRQVASLALAATE
ncbi:hypothetical protein Nepgr_009081 [Nepenthes gracilis]|uniref:Uncharacterized protein n=1 Tax=Nepenthes gracilis TaxID=150966 RepID=A0AAD3SAB7_NEPGR|nr:hypothetical protein Nepgr_009081 [Nepenthes gracilis]